jgi:low temperature requirement protein LtrA
LLGESVLAAVNAIRAGLAEHQLTWQLLVVSAGAFITLFAIWWLYFLEPVGHSLQRHRKLAFSWGYGHVFVFVALALIGAGLEVLVSLAAGGAQAESTEAVGPLAAGYALAGPVALALAGIWALTCLTRLAASDWLIMSAGLVAVLATPLIGGGWPDLAAVITASLVALVTAAVVGAVIYQRHRQAQQHPALQHD